MNMENLKHNGKVAVLRVLRDIMHADGVVREEEVDYMNRVARSWDFPADYMDEVEAISTLQALSILRSQTMDEKVMIAQMMGKMIVIDEDINYNEVKLYNTVCEACNIEATFDVEDYPGYTLSGPFLNPEDMMNL